MFPLTTSTTPYPMIYPEEFYLRPALKHAITYEPEGLQKSKLCYVLGTPLPQHFHSLKRGP